MPVEPTPCQFCSAPVLAVLSPTGRKLMLLNPADDPGGAFWIDDGGRGHVNDVWPAPGRARRFRLHRDCTLLTRWWPHADRYGRLAA